MFVRALHFLILYYSYLPLWLRVGKRFAHAIFINETLDKVLTFYAYLFVCLIGEMFEAKEDIVRVQPQHKLKIG